MPAESPHEWLIHDGEQECPYLPDRRARMPLRRQAGPLGLDDTDRRFAGEERRVGMCLYRTACADCSECRGLRVLVDEFSPSKSQRRVARRGQDVFRVEIGVPSCTPEKLALYRRHKLGRALSDPDDEQMTPEGYSAWLVVSCLLTVEMRYYIGDRLVGLSVIDIGREALSSVYFTFDPDPEVSKWSPGVYSVLQEIELARNTGRKFLYLGLWVRDCEHLAYKADYEPHERVEGARWVRSGSPSPT